VQRTCSGEVLQAQVGMDNGALTQRLLPARTSETCAGENPAGAEPRSRRRLTAAAFAQGAKDSGAERKM